MIVGVAAALLSAAAVVSATRPLVERFADQRRRLDEARTALAAATETLHEFQRLKARLEEVEAEFRRVERGEAPLSLLEAKLKERVGGPPGFYSISDRPPVPFGTTHEETNFSVSFRTPSLANLVSFLREITFGDQPFLMPRLTVERSFSGDRLDVKLELKSIATRGASEQETYPTERDAAPRRS